jgi:excisionase family DNA binding protein
MEDQVSDLLTSLEVAQLLNCSPDNIRKLAREGRLRPAITTRAGRLFARRDIEALAAERVQLQSTVTQPRLYRTT